MLQGVLLVILVLVSVALIAVILLQRSEGGALGMGGGPSGFMTTRGAADLLTRTTSILAGIFFLLCIALTVLNGRAHHGSSVVDRLKIDPLSPEALTQKAPVPPPAAPATGTAPATGAAPGFFGAPAPEVHTMPATPAPAGSATSAPTTATPAPPPSTPAPSSPAPASSTHAPAAPAPNSIG